MSLDASTAEASSHLPVLKRVGLVLVLVGLIDICVMIYCIAKEMPYSSSFNIFAVIGGTLLLRGSLKAASAIRWVSVFLLAALVAAVLLFPTLQPPALTYAELKAAPLPFALRVLAAIAGVWLLCWTFRQLNSPVVSAALKIHGVKLRGRRSAVVAGTGLVVLAFGVGTFVQRTDAAARAIQEAREKYGPSYRYHVSSLNYSTNRDGEAVSGIVTAWNDNEVKAIPFSWRK